MAIGRVNILDEKIRAEFLIVDEGSRDAIIGEAIVADLAKYVICAETSHDPC